MFLKLVFAYCISVHLDMVQDKGMPLLHCSFSSHFMQKQPFTSRLVIPLLKAVLRQSVPSQTLFSITCGFVTSY